MNKMYLKIQDIFIRPNEFLSDMSGGQTEFREDCWQNKGHISKHPRKVMLKVILNRLKPETEKIFAEEPEVAPQNRSLTSKYKVTSAFNLNKSYTMSSEISNETCNQAIPSSYY